MAKKGRLMSNEAMGNTQGILTQKHKKKTIHKKHTQCHFRRLSQRAMIQEKISLSQSHFLHPLDQHFVT